MREPLHDFGIDDELLERRRQPALQPAQSVMNQVGVPHDRGPAGHHRFVHRLRVGRVRGVHVGGAVGQVVTPGQLATDQRGFRILRCTERRSAGLHVHVGGKATVHHRRARIDQLQKRDAGQRFGVLLHQRAGDGDRRHGAGQGERRDGHDLVAPGHFDHAPQHRHVELAR